MKVKIKVSKTFLGTLTMRMYIPLLIMVGQINESIASVLLNRLLDHMKENFSLYFTTKVGK